MKTTRLRLFQYLGWFIVVLVVLVLFVFPLATSLLIQTGRLPPGYLKVWGTVESLQIVITQVFMIGWIFFVGACFASFLNVVAWRLPRGRSILGSSHCPDCDTKLAMGDNLPVIGWLRNRGRCRNCGLPIPVRYLVAELVLGFLFLLLAGVQLAGNGINLPFRPVQPPIGFEQLLLSVPMVLLLPLLYFLVLVSALFTFAWIESERLPIPKLLFLFFFCVGVVMPLVWPEVILVPWNAPFVQTSPPRFSLDLFLTLVLGIAAGGGVGLCFRSAYGVLGWGLVGLFLGWQSVVAILVIFLVLLGLAILLRRFRNVGESQKQGGCCNLNALLLAATVIHLMSWRVQMDGLAAIWLQQATDLL